MLTQCENKLGRNGNNLPRNGSNASRNGNKNPVTRVAGTNRGATGITPRVTGATHLNPGIKNPVTSVAGTSRGQTKNEHLNKYSGTRHLTHFQLNLLLQFILSKLFNLIVIIADHTKTLIEVFQVEMLVRRMEVFS
jgi:hypothetical protein